MKPVKTAIVLSLYTGLALCTASPVLPLSADYRVWLNDQEQPVYQSRKNTNHGTNGIESVSFVGFDLNQPTVVRIQILRKLTSFEIRPYAGATEAVHHEDMLTFTLEKPQKLVLFLNGSYDAALALFANPPHQAPAPEIVDHYYGPGVHDIGHHKELASGDTVYLAEGAVVRGSFALADVHDVTITGRGIIDGTHIPHQENYRVIRGDHTQNTLIEGITIVNAPGWIISFWGGNENLTVRNVKTIGSFRYNSDGVQTGTVGLLVEDCFLQCNDDNFSLNGICQDVEIRNNILWNLYNGGVFMLGWATGQHFDLRNLAIHNNIILRAGGCCDYDRKAPISMKIFGLQRKLQGVVIENLIIEDIAPYGRWLDLQAAKSNHSTLRDIQLSNIDILNTWSIEAEIRGSDTSPIQDVNLTQVSIKGQLLQTPTDGGLNLINTRNTTIQGQSFKDQIVIDPRTPPQNPNTGGGSSRTDRKTPPSGDNLLANPGFENDMEHWSNYNPDRCRVTLINDPTHQGTNAIRVDERRSHNTGVVQDITQILQDHGPGDYTYAVYTRAVNAPCELHLVLKLVTETGPQWHPSPNAHAINREWTLARRTYHTTWTELKEATLYLESGAGGKEPYVADDFYLVKGK